MQVKLLQDFDCYINDKAYMKDEIIEVSEISISSNYYAHYYNMEGHKMDWIPKNLIEQIEVNL